MYKNIPLILLFSLAASVLSAATVSISTIEQLDDIADFSFSILSDNKGYDPTHATSTDTKLKNGGIASGKMVNWIKSNDAFALGSGDHIFPNRDRFINVMEDDPFFHRHFYPNVGDHDNETKYVHGVTGGQNEWGRGWVIFHALDNFFNRNTAIDQITFRPLLSSKVSSGGQQYDDQKVDYYARRTQGNFTFHIISVHYGDASVFAPRSKDFMIDKLQEIAAFKTSYDIVVVLTHCKGHFFQNAMSSGHMNQSEVDIVMTNADLVTDASNHVYERHMEYDNSYGGTGAMWVNTGAAADTGDTWGYVTFHVFDNPPRFTMQFIDIQREDTRKLRIGPKPRHSSNVTDEETLPYLKYIDGPIEAIDWNNFALDGSVPPPPPPPPPGNPVVSFDTPSGDVNLNAGDDLYVNVSATDPDGINRVRLYKDNVELARSEGGAPYEWNASGQNDPELLNLPEGSFVLTARATDNAGDVGEASINVTVGAGGPPPAGSPTVSFVSPAGNTTINSGDTLYVNVSASDSDGIDRVYLFKDGNQLSRSEGGAPYEWNSSGQNDTELQSMQPGTYVITARATDNLGNSNETFITVTVVGDPITEGVFTYGSFTSSYGITMPYRLYVPVGYDPGTQYPIILAFHGLGSRGSDNEKQLAIPITSFWGTAEAQAIQKCFVLAPHMPDGETWVKAEPGGYNGSYTRNSETTTDFLRTAWEILDDVMANYSIDETRQRVCGHSAGGYATFDTIYNHPNRFAAAMPVSGGGDPSTVNITLGNPVWAVHGSDDVTVPPSGSSDMINAFLAAGQDPDIAKVTILNGVGHDPHLPDANYPEHTNWFLSQVNTRIGTPPPPPPPPPNNLVLNGSFESGGASPTSWNLHSSASGSTDFAQAGSSSLKIVGPASPTKQTISTLEANTDYNISVWILNSAVTSGNIVFDTQDVFDGPGQGQFVVAPGAASTWTEYSGSFNSGTVTSITLRIFGTSMVGTAYFDNIVLEKVGTTPPPNNVPVITSTAVIMADENVAYNYTATATDADGDSLVFSLPVKPSWLTLNGAVLSGTPGSTDVGDHNVTLRVTDGADSVDQIFTITVNAAPDPYEQWKSDNNVTDDMADDDGDGIENILEYALGGDPKSSTSGQRPSVEDNGVTIDFKFKRQESTVTYTIEKSTDLVNWTDHVTVSDTHGTVGSDATVPVSVSEMSNGKLFLRLKIEN